MLDDLQQFGLSEKEAQVYLASVKLGSATVNQLAQTSGVNRSTAYIHIDGLMSQGLMSTYQEGKKTYYVPESPEQFEYILNQRQTKLEEDRNHLSGVLSSLMDVYEKSGEQPSTRFFQGKAGLVAMRDEVLKTKDKHLRVMLSFEHLTRVFNKQERTEFSQRRVEKGISVQMIFTDREETSWDWDLTEVIQVAQDDLPLEADMYVYDDKVALASLHGTISGVIIESPAIARSMQAMFDLSWRMLDKKKSRPSHRARI